MADKSEAWELLLVQPRMNIRFRLPDPSPYIRFLIRVGLHVLWRIMLTYQVM
jgi:hypothetical protein